MATRADDRGLFKRGRRWWLRVYVRGEGKRVMALKPEGQTHATTNRDVARALAREIRRQIEEKGTAPRRPESVPELLQAFLAVSNLKATRKQSVASQTRAAAFMVAQDISMPAAITTAAIQDFLVSLAAGMKPWTEEKMTALRLLLAALEPEADEDAIRTRAKRLCSSLCRPHRPKSVWNWRASLGRFCEFLVDREVLDRNPCRRIRIAKTEKLLPRFLSPEEHEQALALAKKNGIYAEVATALYTGMRREELRRMAWADVDFKRSVVMVPKTKSRRPRAIPMSDKLRAVLEDQRAETGERKHVFPGRKRKDHSGMRRGSWWVDALKPLQDAMPVFTADMAETATGRGWHLFRHTFASRLVQAGVPIAKVSAWLGHSDIRTTMIYAHLAPGHDRDIEHA